MRVVDAIAEILRREGVEFLSCYPTTIMIEAAAAIGIRPVLCRQERVGVDIADGYSRVSNGKRIGVFAMQYGPGAENAFPGIATAYSDSAPLLVLPLGHARAQAGVFPNFRASRTYASVTKNVEELLVPEQVGEAMRRAYSLLKNGRSGPVMIELPVDVASADPGEAWKAYRPVRAAQSAGSPSDVDAAAKALVEAQRPVIYAGQGTLYAEATDDLVELAELLQVPVATTLEGKSAFPEDHPLALGAAGTSLTGHGRPLDSRGRPAAGRGCRAEPPRHVPGDPAWQDDRPDHQRPPRLQQGVPDRLPDPRRREGGAAPADRGGQGPRRDEALGGSDGPDRLEEGARRLDGRVAADPARRTRSRSRRTASSGRPSASSTRPT